MEMESREIVGLGRSPDISTIPWKYHISKLYKQKSDMRRTIERLMVEYFQHWTQKLHNRQKWAPLESTA